MKKLYLFLLFSAFIAAQTNPNYNLFISQPEVIFENVDSDAFYTSGEAQNEFSGTYSGQMLPLVNPEYKWLHPSPIGTSMGTIKVWDANTVYAFGSGGTFVKTTDGGQTFSLNPFAGVPLGSPVNTTYDIYGSYFFDMNTFYLCGALGVTKTTDGGQTFNAVGTGSITSGTARRIQFVDQNVGFIVGTSTIRMMKTTDGGNTWAMNSILPSTTYYGLQVFSENKILVGGSTSSSANIRVTTDAGASWNNFAAGNGTIYSFAFMDSLLGFAGSSSGRGYKTTDGGFTWNQVLTAPTTSTFYEVFIKGTDVYFVEDDSLLFVTPDSGATFSTKRYLPIGKPNQIMRSGGFSGSNLYVIGDNGYFIKSTDNGTTWNTNSTVLAGGFVQGIYGDQTGKVISIGTNNPAHVLVSDDFGQNFTPVQLSVTSADLRSIHMFDAITGYAVGSGGRVWKTTNGGYNWNLYSGTTTAQAFNDVSFYNEQYGMTAGNAGQAWKTTDGGTTWVAMTTLSVGQTTIAMIDSITALIGGGTTVNKTTDGGTTWTPITPGVPIGPISRIRMRNSTLGYLVGGSGTSSTGYVFKTTNAGDTWSNMNFPFTGTMLYDIEFRSDSDYVVVGFGGGVFHTTNDGTTWTQFNLGLLNLNNSQVIGLAFTQQDTIIVGGGGATLVKVALTPIAATTFQLSVNVLNGWNMVSIPGLHPVDQNVNTWWSFRDLGANVFKYTGGYQSVTDATPGVGYWMKHAGDRTYNTGEEWPAGGIQIVSHTPLTAASGWNLIGGFELSVGTAGITTNPPGLQSGPVYKYSGGYQVATTLDPGYGYWIKLNDAGQIIIPEVLAKATQTVEYFPYNWGRIILTDATGISYTLYVIKNKVDLAQYDLPPVPMPGMFDIRFSSGRIAEDINSSMKTIDMSGIIYPLTIRVEGMDIKLMDETAKYVNVNLKSGEDVVISDAAIQKLMVTSDLLPAAYLLEQNFPNPFNPSTVIEFSMPEDVSNVKLSIYNALGEKVAELVNTSLAAGKYSYQWNAKNVATGMYIYELRTDKFVSVKKMLLLK